ncbi:MAG: 3-dehydroquinate synthase [Cyclobacteriaceae bacterium]|nr:3-dehydroquinate synthase [Cyclobacteriaceae bacterium]
MAKSLPKYLEITETSGISIANFLKKNSFSKVFVLVDENTGHYCLPLVQDYIGNHQKIEIESGEANKNLETCSTIWQALTDAEADRKSLLINLGGGVIGDMGGFCASTYKRGIAFVNIPTTLLAQVDASIGGKLGIDFNGFKNHIGVFNMPVKVIVDPWFLKTLPRQQLTSGIAEMIKHAFIKDVTHLKHLGKLLSEDADWASLIKKSILIKNEIVEADPFESGERKLLNFGHTVGHAIESYFLEKGKPILHGEAVAAGMITEAFLSEKLMDLSTSDRDYIAKVVDSYFKRVEIPESDWDTILNNLEQDKKNAGKSIQAVLLAKPEEARHSIAISKEDVRESLAFYTLK